MALRPSSSYVVVRRRTSSVTRATASTVQAFFAKFGQNVSFGDISRRFFHFFKILNFEF